MKLKHILFFLAFSLACALNAAEINLRNYIIERYRAGERVIILPDGDVDVGSAFCKLGPEIQNLEIRGGKQTRLIVNSYKELFYLSGCRNVKLSGFTVDHRPLLFTQGTITKIEGSLYYFRLHDGYPRMGKQFLNRHPHFFDRETRKFKWGNTMESGDCKEIRAINSGSGVIEYTAPVSGIRTGDFVVLSYRKAAAFKIDDFAADLLLENITVYNAGYGIMSRRSEGHVTVRNFRIVPGPLPPGASEPRLLATCADAFNFAASRQGPVIENCEVNAIGDDSINLHGTPMPVVAKTPAGDPVVCIPTSCKRHIELFRPGDTVLVLRPGNYEIKQRVKLRAVHPVEFRDPAVLKKVFPRQKRDLILSFALKLENAEVSSGDLLDIPAANCPGFTIRNNSFSNHRA